MPLAHLVRATQLNGQKYGPAAFSASYYRGVTAFGSTADTKLKQFAWPNVVVGQNELAVAKRRYSTVAAFHGLSRKSGYENKNVPAKSQLEIGLSSLQDCKMRWQPLDKHVSSSQFCQPKNKKNHVSSRISVEIDSMYCKVIHLFPELFPLLVYFPYGYPSTVSKEVTVIHFQVRIKLTKFFIIKQLLGIPVCVCMWSYKVQTDVLQWPEFL